MTREEAIKTIRLTCPKISDSECDFETAMRFLIPELAESEDERIRKELVNFLQSPFIKENLTDEKVAPYLAYLEKQKEQIPYTDFIIKPHKGDDNNPYDMRVSEAQEYAIKRGFGIPFNDGEVYVDERHMTQTIGNIIRWADEHPKEQKPTEPSDEELVRHPPIAYTYPSDASRDEQLKMALLALLNSDLIKVAGNKFTKQDLIDWVEKRQEQKPAEWSEEDENQAIKDIIPILKDVAYQGSFGNPNQETMLGFARRILKSLPLRCPKSSDNWRPSEELIGCLERVIAFKHPEPEDIDGCNSLIEQLKKLI